VVVRSSFDAAVAPPSPPKIRLALERGSALDVGRRRVDARFFLPIFSRYRNIDICQPFPESGAGGVGANGMIAPLASPCAQLVDSNSKANRRNKLVTSRSETGSIERQGTVLREGDLATLSDPAAQTTRPRRRCSRHTGEQRGLSPVASSCCRIFRPTPCMAEFFQPPQVIERGQVAPVT